MKIFSWILLPSIFVLFWVFLKIGLVFFGGGYAVIPVMHRELVNNLHLLTERQFIDGIAMSQLTPGPIAILATFSGYCISGVLGALTATFAMFLPGSLLMLVLSKSYNSIKNSNTALKVLNTIIPVIVGLLISVAWQIGETTIAAPLSLVLFFGALFALIKYEINPALLIIVSAVLGFILKL